MSTTVTRDNYEVVLESLNPGFSVCSQQRYEDRSSFTYTLMKQRDGSFLLDTVSINFQCPPRYQTECYNLEEAKDSLSRHLSSVFATRLPYTNMPPVWESKGEA